LSTGQEQERQGKTAKSFKRLVSHNFFFFLLLNANNKFQTACRENPCHFSMGNRTILEEIAQQQNHKNEIKIKMHT